MRALIQQLIHSPVYAAALGLLCGVVGFRLGWRTQRAVLLPVVQAVMGFVAFATEWRSAGPIGAALAVGGWAVGTTLVSIPVFLQEPEAVDERVLRARAYREEMLSWLRSGRGPESRPWTTVRRHLVELGAYVAGALATANLAGLAMGAVLLNFMNAWVAHLVAHSRRRWAAPLLGWPVWSVVRLASYVMLGAGCAAPLAEVLGFPAVSAEVRWLIVAGALGIPLDLVLKLALSRSYARSSLLS